MSLAKGKNVRKFSMIMPYDELTMKERNAILEKAMDTVAKDLSDQISGKVDVREITYIELTHADHVIADTEWVFTGAADPETWQTVFDYSLGTNNEAYAVVAYGDPDAAIIGLRLTVGTSPFFNVATEDLHDHEHRKAYFSLIASVLGEGRKMKLEAKTIGGAIAVRMPMTILKAEPIAQTFTGKIVEE